MLDEMHPTIRQAVTEWKFLQVQDGK